MESSHIRITVLLISVLFLSGAWEIQPALGGDEIQCAQYAKTAISQNRQNMEKACGFTGPAWSDNYSHHYNWCLRVEKEQADAGTRQRLHELNINCVSSTRNPQPMENPPLKELEQPKLLTPTALPNLVPKVETQNGLHTFDGKTIRVKVRNKGTGYVWGDEYKVGIRPAGPGGQQWMGTAVGKKIIPGQEVIVDVPWSPGTVNLQNVHAFVAVVDIENKVYEGDSGETDNASEPFQLMDMSGYQVLPTEPQTATIAKKQLDADLAIEDAGFFGDFFGFGLANKGQDPIHPEILRMMKVHAEFIFDDPSKNQKCTIYMEDLVSNNDMPIGKYQGAIRSITITPSLDTRFGCPPGKYSS